MTEKDYQARITELETENRQLRERLADEVTEVENLTELLHELKKEFAEIYAMLEVAQQGLKKRGE